MRLRTHWPPETTTRDVDRHGISKVLMAGLNDEQVEALPRSLSLILCASSVFGFGCAGRRPAERWANITS